jgi:hypothetical protein
MPLARRFESLLRRYLRAVPSDDETRVFTTLAADATSLGRLLARNGAIGLGYGEALDLADGGEREILAATLRAGAVQHLRAREDVLTLVERLNGMIDAAQGRRDAMQRTEVGIALLRAIAVVELLTRESRERYPGCEPLGRLAVEARSAVAYGYVRTFGADVPPNVRRAFPAFAQAVREAPPRPDSRVADADVAGVRLDARPPG